MKQSAGDLGTKLALRRHFYDKGIMAQFFILMLIR